MTRIVNYFCHAVKTWGELNRYIHAGGVWRILIFFECLQLIIAGLKFDSDNHHPWFPLGQFETEEEKSAKVREHLAGHGEGKFSEFLLHQSDRSDYLERNVEEEEEDVSWITWSVMCHFYVLQYFMDRFINRGTIIHVKISVLELMRKYNMWVQGARGSSGFLAAYNLYVQRRTAGHFLEYNLYA